MNSLMQLSRALMEAKQEKESAVAQALIEAKTERLETAADAKQQELLKVCNSSSFTMAGLGSAVTNFVTIAMYCN